MVHLRLIGIPVWNRCVPFLDKAWYLNIEIVRVIRSPSSGAYPQINGLPGDLFQKLFSTYLLSNNFKLPTAKVNSETFLYKLL